MHFENQWTTCSFHFVSMSQNSSQCKNNFQGKFILFNQFYQKYFFQSYVTVTSLKSSNGLYLLSKLRIFTHSQNKGNIKSLALPFRGEDPKLPTPWGQKNCRLGHMDTCLGHPLPHCLQTCCPESCLHFFLLYL